MIAHASLFLLVLAAQTAPAPEAPMPAVAPAAAPTAESGAAADTPAVPALPKLLVLDTKSGDLTKDQTEALTAIITARAAKFGQVDVTSAQDVRALAQVEADKQAAGCDGESCLAEIAGAMGAQYVLVTRAGKLGSSYVVAVQLYDANKGAAEARDTAEAFSVDELPAKMTTAVDGMLTQALGAPLPPRPKSGAPVVVAEAAAAPEAESGPDALHLGLQIAGASALIVGAALVGVGVTPLALYNQKKGELNQRTDNYTGKTKQLEEAAKVHADAVWLRGFYNGPGRVLWIGGALLALAGGGALAAGFFLPPLDELTGGAPAGDAAAGDASGASGASGARGAP